jgi:uncharacterized protein YjbJ (UPF0337 family)
MLHFGKDEEGPMASIFKAQELHQKHHAAVDKTCRERSEEAENGFLMEFWQYLGDHTETYTLAMKLAGAFQKLQGKIQEELGKIPADNRLRFAEVLVLAAQHQVETVRQINKLEADCLRDFEALKKEVGQ